MFEIGGVRIFLQPGLILFRCIATFTRKTNLWRHQKGRFKAIWSPAITDKDDAVIHNAIELALRAVKKRKLDHLVTGDTPDAIQPMLLCTKRTPFLWSLFFENLDSL